VPIRPAALGFVASVALLGGVIMVGVATTGDPRSDLRGVAVTSLPVEDEMVTTDSVVGWSPNAGAFEGSLSNRSNESPTVSSRPGSESTTAPTTTPQPKLPVPTTAPQRSGIPRRIVIPTIEVDAPVVAVGLESDGSMEIPGANEGGWYHYGVRPGHEVGSAVIAGHVDFAGQPGVFLRLNEVEIGQLVKVYDNQGKPHRFSVTERFQIDKDELPGPELFRADGRPVLTLITCGGSFNRKLRRYTDNIVIRADLIEKVEDIRPDSR
jgi:LPXTG-site transpeptidase (sortase) family protein